MWRHLCITPYPQSSSSKDCGPERFGDDSKQTENKNPAPRIKERKDGKEIRVLRVRVSDVSRVGEAPGHEEDEDHDEKAGALGGQLLHDTVLAGLRQGDVKDNDEAEQKWNLEKKWIF